MSEQRKTNQAVKPVDPAAETPKPAKSRGPKQPEGEVGGPEGPEPTRFGDWEVGGRCSDF